MLHRFYIHYMS